MLAAQSSNERGETATKPTYVIWRQGREAANRHADNEACGIFRAVLFSPISDLARTRTMQANVRMSIRHP